MEEKEDFFPGFGKFEAPIYNIPMTFFGQDIHFNFGILPDSLETAMLSGRTQAIIGADIFSHFSLIFHYSNKKIYIKNCENNEDQSGGSLEEGHNEYFMYILFK